MSTAGGPPQDLSFDLATQSWVEIGNDNVIREHVSTQRRLRFLQALVPAIYTGLAYLAIVGGLAVVARLDATDVDSAGAVMPTSANTR